MKHKSSESFLITPQQVMAIAKDDGLDDEKLSLSGLAVMTFSRAIMERLEELCGLEDAEWISMKHHPYGAPQVAKRGRYEGMEVFAVVPPMAPSPLSCVVEDLAACGAKAIFLVCAAWSLGPPVKFGDLIVPEFSVGPDGTSIHYGNTSGRAEADPDVVEALTEAGRERGATVHVGGNATCEALYRISPQMVEDFREQGCFCMENGEANMMYSMARTLGFVGGVLFQPYIDLPQGWSTAPLLDELYGQTCHLQADVVLDACLRLREEGVLRI